VVHVIITVSGRIMVSDRFLSGSNFLKCVSLAIWYSSWTEVRSLSRYCLYKKVNRKHKVAIMHGHRSHNTTIFANFYITYQLHVSAISDLAIIRLDTIIRETIYCII